MRAAELTAGPMNMPAMLPRSRPCGPLTMSARLPDGTRSLARAKPNARADLTPVRAGGSVGVASLAAGRGEP